jgi:hypothetical protein
MACSVTRAKGWASERPTAGPCANQRTGHCGTGCARPAVPFRRGGRADPECRRPQHRPPGHRALLEQYLCRADRRDGARSGRAAAGRAVFPPRPRRRVCRGAGIDLGQRPGRRGLRLADPAPRRRPALGPCQPLPGHARRRDPADPVHADRHHRAQGGGGQAAARRRQFPPVVRTLERRHRAARRGRHRRRQPGRGAPVPLFRQAAPGGPSVRRCSTPRWPRARWTMARATSGST